jgi:hypothetical protein
VVGAESERAKTVHALDRSATVVGAESERAKTVHAFNRSATVTGVYRIKKVKKRRRSTRAVKPERDVIIDKD